MPNVRLHNTAQHNTHTRTRTHTRTHTHTEKGEKKQRETCDKNSAYTLHIIDTRAECNDVSSNDAASSHERSMLCASSKMTTLPATVMLWLCLVCKKNKKIK